MKTIEERAEEYMNNYPHMDDSHYDYYVSDGYIQGATEQRDIDIETATEWLRKQLEVLAVDDNAVFKISNVVFKSQIQMLVDELKEVMNK